MATRDQLLQALKGADNAGDTKAATALARAIQEMDAQPKPTLGDKLGGLATGAGRAIGQFGHGFNDSLASTLGAVPDALNWAARESGAFPALGLKTTPPGFYADKIKQGIESLVPPPPPAEGTLERGAYGAGRGVADAASIAIPAAGVARSAQAGSMLGRVASGLAAQPGAQAVAGAVGGGVGQATDNPLLGLGASLAVPFGAAAARRAVSPVINRLTPEAQRLAGVAHQEGIQLTPGQQTGSRPLQTAESVLGTLPLSAGMAQTRQQAQRVALNRAVLRRAGIAADAATPDVLDAAHTRLGHEFQQLSGQTTVRFDRQLGQDLTDIANRYYQTLPVNQRPIFAHYLQDLQQTAANNRMTLPGAAYQLTRSRLGSQAKAAMQNDPHFGNALHALQNALDDAAGRAIPHQLQDRWQDARRQYGNLRIIEDAMASPSAEAASGNIPPALLWRGVKNQRGSAGMARGRGDLNDLSRVGQQFLKQQIPNSGTPERTQMTRWLTGGLPLTGALVGGVPGAVAGMGAAALSALTPPAIQALMGTAAGRAWLTNQVAHGIGPQANPALISAILAGRMKDPSTRSAVLDKALGQ